MGPRARRRVFWIAGVVVSLVIVGGLIHHLTRSSPHSAATKIRIGTMNLGISFGFTPKQVVRRLGKPSQKQGGCWVYKAQGGKVNGIFASSLTDAVRFCFASGIVSDIKDHDVAHVFGKRHIPASWGPPIYIAPNEHNVPLQF